MRHDVASLEWSLFGLRRVEHARGGTTRPNPATPDVDHDLTSRRRLDDRDDAFDRRRRIGPRARRRLHPRIDDVALWRARRGQIDTRPDVASNVGRERDARLVDRG